MLLLLLLLLLLVLYYPQSAAAETYATTTAHVFPLRTTTAGGKAVLLLLLPPLSLLHLLELFEELHPFDVVASAFEAAPGCAVTVRASGGAGLRTGCCVEVSDGRDSVEPILEGGKSGRLREQHEEAVETLVKVGVFLRFQELETEVGEHGRFKEVHELVDLDQQGDGDLELGNDGEEVGRLFVCLCKETKRKGCHGVVAPRAEERYEERLAVFGLQTPQTFP